MLLYLSLVGVTFIAIGYHGHNPVFYVFGAAFIYLGFHLQKIFKEF